MKISKIVCMSLTLFLIVATIVLSILGGKQRVGYISEFNLDNTLTTEMEYIYHARVKYYNKVFRNSDIYGVYAKPDNLPDYIEFMNFDEPGSPFGFFSSTKELSFNDKVDNINYVLKVKSHIFNIVFILVLISLLLIFYNHLKIFFVCKLKLKKNAIRLHTLELCLIILAFVYCFNILIVFFNYLDIIFNNRMLVLFLSVIVLLLFIYGFHFIYKYFKKYSSLEILIILELISLAIFFPIYHHYKFALATLPINLFVLSFFILFILVAFISFFMFLKQLYLEGFFNLKNYEIISLLLFCVVNILYICIYLNNSRELLIYDPLGYWINVVYFKFDFNYIINTLLFSDYDTFFTIPSSIFCKIFGNSRLVFSISLFIIYYFPTTFIIALFARKYFNKFNAPIFVICLLSYFMIPLFTYDLLHSFHMYGAFTFGICSWLSWIRLKKEDDLKLQILLPLFLVFMFLWKRWMLYWIIPFVIIVVFESLYTIVKEKNYKPFKRLIPIGLIGMLLLVGLFLPRFVRIIVENYSVSYSAFRVDVKQLIKHVFAFYGYYIVIIPFLVLFCFKKTRGLSVRFLSFFLIVFYCFLKINRPGAHHLMIGGFVLLLVLTLLFSFCYEKLINLKLNNICRNILITCLLLIPIVAFGFSFTDKYYFNLRPRFTKNIDDIVYTYNNLPRDGVIYNSNCGSYFGADFSALDSIYFQFNKFYELENKPIQLITSHIDLRDGLNYGIFDSDYFFSSVIPHGCETKQQVTHYTIKVFNENINISKAFVFEKEFMYGTITNKLYKRIRQNTREEIYEYINYFNKYYTNNAKFPEASIIDEKVKKYYRSHSNI